MSVFVCGDVHGNINWNKLNSDNFPQGKTLTKDDYVIVCGDFGAIWDNSNRDKYLQKWYTEKPWTTLFVDGNHENFNLLNQYPVDMWHGGKVHFITPSVIHLMRGQVYTICGKTFFTMGGAASHDKQFRIDGRDWWSEEMPSMAEMNEGLNNLPTKVDYIITHCAPSNIQLAINPSFEFDTLTKYLQIVEDTVDFDHWYFGHYHRDQAIDEKHTVLYHTIQEIKT